MTEKRYKNYKYVYCYCSKHEQVQLGLEIYKYINTFCIIVGIAFTLVGLFSDISVQDKLILICVLGIPAVGLPPYNYLDAKKTMQKAGHSEACSRKIARRVMFRASLWSEFKIMKDKDDGKRLWR